MIAGEEWGAPMQEMEVPPAKKGSIEFMLHEQKKNGYLLFNNETDDIYARTIPHRAIGVVYDPAMEKYGNYVPSTLSRCYDALIFIDETMALHPLHLHPDKKKLPETFPFDV